MANYVDQVTAEKKFISNIVIKIGAIYFSMRTPDSGLSISSPYNKMVSGLTLNQAAIDIKRVNTTIASYTFKLIDKDNIISNLMLGNGLNLVGQDVTIWLGRNRRNVSVEANDFSGYYQLPITKIKKIDHSDNSYTFTTNEDTDRIAKPIFAATSALAVDILAATTTIQMRDAIDEFPAAGYVHVDKEIFSYTTKNDAAKTFSGVIRGEFGTTPADHSANTDSYHSQVVIDNPLNIILRILTSGGGGGTYDNLNDGLGISQSLIDISGIETIRDSLFIGVQIRLELSNVDSALKIIESEILQPFNLRIKYSDNAKLSLVVLDKAVFSSFIDSITENSITTYPKWNVDDTKIINKIKINWDYSEAEGKFLKYNEFTNPDSIATYGLRNPLTFSFKGIRSSLNGLELLEEYSRVLFARFSTPVAEVEVKTHIDKSLKNIGDKVYVESTKIPSPTGGLDFGSDMEITSRSINYQTNEASFKFAFTSFTDIRSGYISPSDKVLYIESQKKLGVLFGRYTQYRVGWYMRLWNDLTNSYEPDAPNKIVSISTGDNKVLLDSGFDFLLDDGSSLVYDQDSKDLITFENNWATTLTLDHRIRFANYDEVEDTQKRYCFISDNGNNFDDGKTTYKVTY